jgi:O-methyltransferase involved in polyketide biosynthesis
VPQPAVALDVTDAELSGKLAQVSKTAVLTLRARADEQHRPDRVLLDPVAAEWMARLPWPPELDGWYQNDAQGNLALRADDVDQIVRRCVAQLGTRVVVELGCGLSTRRQRLAELSQLEWLDVDLPPMIALREALGAPPPHVAGSVLDLAWLDVVPNSETPPLLIAEGLLYYLPRTEVDRLFAAIAARLPGAVILFDVVGVDDFPRLLENSSSVGAPVAWKLERNFDQVLVGVWPGSDPGVRSRRADEGRPQSLLAPLQRPHPRADLLRDGHARGLGPAQRHGVGPFCFGGVHWRARRINASSSSS